MISKGEIILNTPKMKDLLTFKESNPQGSGVVLDSEQYTLFGCDLRNLRRLEDLMRRVVSVEDCLVLCVAEVSITYMHPDAADELLAWSSSISSGTSIGRKALC